MGCDISWHVERQRDDGSWEHLPDIPEPDRWYGLFSALAGVRSERGDPPARFEPQLVLPPDVSADVRALYGDGEGDFATSYRTLAELNTHDWAGFCGSGFEEVLNAMAAIGSPERVRAVFWFSS